MKKILVLLAVVIVVVCFFVFDLNQYVSLDKLRTLIEQNWLLAALLFFGLYVAVASLNLPGAGPLTLVAGAAFGFFPGVILVSFASTIGATFSMLVSRTLLRDWAQKRFSQFLVTVNRGIELDGSAYLFTLRLIPLIPFFVINPVFGLTKMPVWKYYIVSQLGMLPATLLYVNVGASLGEITDVSFFSLLTPQILISFALLILFPFVIKRIMSVVRRKMKLRKYVKPKKFDTNLAVVGAGSAGLVSAYIASAVNAKVTLIEKEKMGGDCLNTGCVPSKTLIRSAKAAHQIRKASEFGVTASLDNIDFPAVMQRVQSVIKEIEPNDSVERYESLGVECVTGEAQVLSPYEVKVDGRSIFARKIIIAAGARPNVPPIPGLEDVAYCSSDSLWDMTELPKRLLVLGGGAIGCELAQAFSRLGSDVTLVELADRLLPNTDESVGQELKKVFERENISLKLSTKVESFAHQAGKHTAQLVHKGESHEVEFDCALLALGRRANTDSEALKHLDFALNKNGTLLVDEYLETSVPGIYACGDIVGPYQFTHAASHQAWYASVNALFGVFKNFRVNYDALPWVVYTDPEIAHVGETEQSLKDKEIPYEVTLYHLNELDRALAEGEKDGFVQVITRKGNDRILGATIISSRAGEMITEFVSAMKYKRGLNSILSTIHSYPTFGEASRFAAGAWKRNNKPEKILKLMSSWFAFFRST